MESHSAHTTAESEIAKAEDMAGQPAPAGFVWVLTTHAPGDGDDIALFRSRLGALRVATRRDEDDAAEMAEMGDPEYSAWEEVTTYASGETWWHNPEGDGEWRSLTLMPLGE
jgi:hypothetical protein